MALTGEEVAASSIYLPERQVENLSRLALDMEGGQAVVAHMSSELEGSETRYGQTPSQQEVKLNGVGSYALVLPPHRYGYAGRIGMNIGNSYHFGTDERTSDMVEFVAMQGTTTEVAVLATAEEVTAFFESVDPDSSAKTPADWPSFIAYSPEAVDRVMARQFDIGDLAIKAQIVTHIILRGDDPVEILGLGASSPEVVEQLKRKYLEKVTDHISSDVGIRADAYAELIEQPGKHEPRGGTHIPLSTAIDPRVSVFVGVTAEEKLDAATLGLTHVAHRLRNDADFESLRPKVSRRYPYRRAVHHVKEIMAEVGDELIGRKRDEIEETLQLALLENALNRHNSRGSIMRERLTRQQVHAIELKQNRISRKLQRRKDISAEVGLLIAQNG